VKKFKVELERCELIESETLAESAKDAAKLAQSQNHGFAAIYVDGIEVVGRCEACGDPVLESENYLVDDELVCICESCSKEMSDDD
jgi:Zn finger protein HypA/HybF involved in hydrogenase expression